MFIELSPILIISNRYTLDLTVYNFFVTQGDISQYTSHGEDNLEAGGMENHCGQDGEAKCSDNLEKCKRRGKTKCNKIKTRKVERLVVEFNEKGQPIRRNSNIFSSYLGAIARARVPISYTTWHKVPKDTKEKYWVEVKAISSHMPLLRYCMLFNANFCLDCSLAEKVYCTRAC